MSDIDKVKLQVLRSGDIVNGGPVSGRSEFPGGKLPKIPNPESLDYGEIALNIAKGYEVIAIKNHDGEMVYLPFNIAWRLLDAEVGLDDLSGYTISSVEALSATTIDIYETIGEFVDDMTQLIHDEIDSLSGSVFGTIDELSADTQTKFGEVMDDISSLGDEIDEVSGTLAGRIDTLSAYTDSRFDSEGQRVDSLIGELSGRTDELSGTVGSINEELGGLSGRVSGLTDSFEEFSGKTTEQIDAISGTVSACTEIHEVVIEDEHVTAGAFAKLNHSLGFTQNAEYVPMGDGLQGLNVSDAIDYIYDECIEIERYIGIEDTTGRIRKIRYEDLYRLRHEKRLLPGMYYRITNYQATINTTLSDRFNTRIPVVSSTEWSSMGFDIILMAVTENILSENAWIVESRDNAHFEICKPESWNVKYCLDNDTNRFAWANSRGFGVIYYMKDNYGNEAPYDFKNIVNVIDGNNTYTFHNPYNDTDLSVYGYATQNVIRPLYSGSGKLELNHISFKGTQESGNIVGTSCNDIVLDGNFSDNYISSSKNGTTITGKTNTIIGYTVEQ